MSDFVDAARRILIALDAGPLEQQVLADLVGVPTVDADSRRRQLHRQITGLRALGFDIEKSATRPPVYTLHGWRVPSDETPQKES